MIENEEEEEPTENGKELRTFRKTRVWCRSMKIKKKNWRKKQNEIHVGKVQIITLAKTVLNVHGINFFQIDENQNLNTR